MQIFLEVFVSAYNLNFHNKNQFFRVFTVCNRLYMKSLKKTQILKMLHQKRSMTVHNKALKLNTCAIFKNILILLVYFKLHNCTIENIHLTIEAIQWLQQEPGCSGLWSSKIQSSLVWKR